MSTNNKEDVQGFIDNITEQLQELEVLTAMYPEELVMTDPTLVIDAQEYCESQGQSSVILQSLTFDLSLVSENGSDDTADDKNEKSQNLHFKLSVKLPKSYPSIERPELSIIADEMSRAELTNAKNAMNDFVSTLALDEQILLEIVMWLQHNLVTFIDKDSKKDSLSDTTKEVKPENNTLISLWLYMHHIYSKHKRKDIQNWSHDYDLTGFSLPGKPGVVYIEGLEANVDAYFDRLKSLPWKSIKCRTREIICKRVFEDFKELCFQPHGARNYHMDLGLFYNFLVENGLGRMFKEIFGVEGQLKDE